MGADYSTHNLSNWQVDPMVVFETDTWKLNNGKCADGSRVSVFESKHSKENRQSLELLAKHLRTLRHPCIVRHLSSGKQKGQLCLVTEQVVPLEILLREKEMTLEEKIAGIYNILQALMFLHDMCGMSHNNVCTTSVFVCGDGCWKLAGFEKMKANQKENDNKSSIHCDDVYAFGQFALHLLAHKDEDSILPGVDEFVAKLEDKCLASVNLRPTCSELCTDLIFKNDFLEIKSFLQNLVLKSEDEKQEFFRYLTTRLIGLPPQLVAQQLSQLLLCRFVFMDKTAVDYFLPSLLCPKTNVPSSSSIQSLLSADLFQKYIIPHLLRIICVRNRHIRMILLKSFCHYVHLFSEEELKTVVLPEILVGICDTNDQMVSITLEALAKLVLLLGSQVVVGGYRQKLFTENVPNNYVNGKEPSKTIVRNSTNSIIPNKTSSSQGIKIKKPNTHLPGINSVKPRDDRLHTLERSSPDGGESPDDEDWTDWTNDVKQNSPPQTPTSRKTSLSEENPSPLNTFSNLATLKGANSTNLPKKTKTTTGLGEEFDIMALDVAKINSHTEEDFFSDMEPTIVTSNHVVQPVKVSDSGSETSFKTTSTFDILEELAEEASGWDDTELHFEWNESPAK